MLLILAKNPFVRNTFYAIGQLSASGAVEILAFLIMHNTSPSKRTPLDGAANERTSLTSLALRSDNALVALSISGCALSKSS